MMNELGTDDGPPQKADIVKVGWIEGDQPVDFTFDCRGKIPMMGFTENGEPLWGNWSLDELREVVARPDEFLQ